MPFRIQKLILICFLFLFSSIVKGQNDSIPKTEKWKLDTNYVATYYDKLVIGLYQSYRFYDLLIVQSLSADTTGKSSMNYIARGNNSTGIDFAWDKISFSLSNSVAATESDTYRKGISKTKNLSFSLNSKRYRLEAAYRKYTGFYDNYTARRDTNFVGDSTAFYQLPGMYSKAFRIKGFYFFNKKKHFSYGAAFNNTARQLKTSGSFLLVSNLYKFRIASDTSIVGQGISAYYPNWENFNQFQNLGASLNLGYSFNLVLWKKLFMNLTGTLGMEAQNFTYANADNSNKRNDWKFGLSAGDLRGSIGYNGKKIYIMLSYIGDVSVYKLDHMQIDTRLHYGSFSFGYRFGMKPNRVTKWIQNNKFYKMI